MKKFLIIFVIGIFLLAFIVGKCNDDMDEIEDDTMVELVITKNSNIGIKERVVPDDNKHPLSLDTTTLATPRIFRSVPEQILVRISYTTSYNNETKCPNWVAWTLTREHTSGPYTRKGVPYYAEDGSIYGIGKVSNLMIKNCYIEDLECEEPRQKLTDWSTDYNMSHGHICPAGDNNWDKAAINQTFLLSNICPQNERLNNGGWKKLEDKCRTWANKYGEIFIVSGPMFRNTRHRRLGDILIPEAFFKVILCMKGYPKAIGFIYENDSSSQPMADKVYSVDDIEEETGIDFFCNLSDDIENEIEANSDFSIWK